MTIPLTPMAYRRLKQEAAEKSSREQLKKRALEAQLQNTIAQTNLANAQIAQTQGYLSGQTPRQPSVDDIEAAISQPSIQPLQGSGQQASDQFRMKQLDPLSAGGLPVTAPLDLRQLQAEQTVRKNVELAGKSLEEDKKARKDIAKQLSSASSFVQEFVGSYDEITANTPDIGKTGPEGMILRFGATIQEKLDQLPKTSAFLKRQKVLANKQARLIEGGRVTDKDREVYADAMANVLAASTKENIDLVAGSLMDIYTGGVDEQGNHPNLAPLLDDYQKSNNPVLIGIAKEVLRRLPAEERRRMLNGT